MAEIGSSKDARPGRRMVTAALLLAMGVAALEQTVVSTAMPSIIAQLKGLDIYPWVFSAYLLASTVTTPVYGKLADLWGRRRVLLFGLGLFTLGSVLSGRASTMPELIAMRVVQGLGAGAIGPIVLTMLGDLFTLEERARVQGLFSAVWGISSVAGPWLGGYLTDNLSWRWVFYVTVPCAILSMWVLVCHVKEDVQKARSQPIDWAGAGLLASGSTLLLLAILRGPSASIGSVVGLGSVALAILAGFVVVEYRASDPILPPDLFTRPSIAAAIAGSFLIGALLFGIDTYVPLYVQGVLGGKATQAGEVITPLFLSWAISVALAAKVVVRFGFRTTGVVGMGMLALGMCGLALGADRPTQALRYFQVSLVVIGLGFGPASLCCILGVQNEVDWNRRGVATGAVTFSRVLGGALGVGMLGATLAFEFSRRLASAGASGIDVVAALRPETHQLLSIEQLHAVQGALGRTLRDVFLQMLGLSVVAILCASRLAAGRAVSRIDRPSEAPEVDFAPIPAMDH
ncbi:MFS transporter [Tundrisphaera lichenicola]|uniref:MFS transporter n=1 Tax=Tundrisphaera lichenicola TaxID=2029860 RepID=UPI003EB926BB